MIDSLLVNPHISDYISSLEPDLPDFLEELFRSARENRVPVIRREAQSLLRFVILDREPRQVLEVGTAIGFSSCFMAEYLSGDARIVTIEKDDKRYREALRNVSLFRENYRTRYNRDAAEISCIEGDAEEELRKLSASGAKFDLLFLDAAKAQYPVYLELLQTMMDEKSILITDNVLQEGTLAESKFTVTRRDRTIHLRMREFTEVLFRSGRYESMMLPVGDGMTLTKKRKM